MASTLGNHMSQAQAKYTAFIHLQERQDCDIPVFEQELFNFLQSCRLHVMMQSLWCGTTETRSPVTNQHSCHTWIWNLWQKKPTRDANAHHKKVNMKGHLLSNPEEERPVDKRTT